MNDNSNKVLTTAIEVLSCDGYDHFSMRNIAKKAGVHLATVQHYFPTKKVLLQETIRKVIDEFDCQMDNVLEKKTKSPEERFILVAKLHFSTCIDPYTAGFFIALWALSVHDPDAKSLLDETYQLAHQRFCRTITELRGDLPKKIVAQRASLILTLFEGANITMRSPKILRVSDRSLKKAFVSTALVIANGELKQ